MLNYLIADMVNRIKISVLFNFKIIIILKNKIIKFICNLLLELGYIYKFCSINFKFLKIFIINKKNKLIIRSFYIISRPSSRIYFSCKNLKGGKLNNYNPCFNFLFISTSKGLLTDLECVFLNWGGEPIAAIN